MDCSDEHSTRRHSCHRFGRYSEPSEIVPFIPAYKASLTINGESITRRFAQRLQKAASSPQLCNKLMERNNWSSHTFESINWEVPGKALDTLENSAKSSLSNLRTRIFQLGGKCIGSNEPHTTNVQPASISHKQNDTSSSAAPLDQYGAMSCSALLERLWPLTTLNTTSL